MPAFATRPAQASDAFDLPHARPVSTNRVPTAIGKEDAQPSELESNVAQDTAPGGGNLEAGHWPGDGHDHEGQPTDPSVRARTVAEVEDQVVAGINTSSSDLKALLSAGTIVHFWASWCAPCEEEFPQLERFYRARILEDLAAKGIRLITISNDFSVAPAARFIKKHGTTFPVFLDTEQTTNMAIVGQRGLPSTVMVGGDGRFHRLALGKLDWDFPQLPEVLTAVAGKKSSGGSIPQDSVKGEE